VRRPVKLILVDDKSDGPTDERAVEELVAGVDVMLGTFGSSLVEKGSAVLGEAEGAVRHRHRAPAARSISAASSTSSACKRPSSSSPTR